MDLAAFLHDRRPSWKRLEELLERAESSSLASLNEDEAVELGNLYRRAASDLNQAQTFVSGDTTVRYLNDLVARTYLLVYGKTRIDLRAMLLFLFWGWPAVFRRYLPHFLIAVGLFVFGAVFGFLACFPWSKDKSAVEAAHNGQTFLLPRDMKTIQPREEGQLDPTQAQTADQVLGFSGFLFTHNLSVTLIAFALGVTLGIGTVWFMFENGLMLGVLGAVFLEAEQNRPGHGYFMTFITGIVPHGVLELPACFIGGAAGLFLAQAMIRARPWPRREEMARLGQEAFLLVSGAVPLLAVAGLLEAGVARAPDWIFPTWVKLTVACAFAVVFLVYTLLLGWGKNPHYRREPA
ncbi:MAG TPA: stage II sporulation protein M [Gemmataceae bacterium]|nr:stage II sporulation protein M [Gemmataceae bacterium]